MTANNCLCTKKNCFLVLKNKKINNFDIFEEIIKRFASHGYYFDKTAFVAYDNSSDIIFALNDGLENYENIYIYCPDSMQSTLKNYICEHLSVQFDDLNLLKIEQKHVFLLLESNDLYKCVDYFCGKLDEKYGLTYSKAFVKTVGAPISKISAAVTQAKEICEGLSINVSEIYTDCTIELVYDNTVSKSLFDSAYRQIISGLQEYLYAVEDVSLAERFVDLLKLRRMKISLAESFTGGGIAKRLVDISGVSEVYLEGLNTYSNQAKSKRLGVEEFTLRTYGAVSKETAYEMARGLFDSGNCNVCIATTGIAGPKSDNTKKPVGLVYIAVGVDSEIKVYEFNLKGSRKQITETAINLALFLAFKTLK